MHLLHEPLSGAIQGGMPGWRQPGKLSDPPAPAQLPKAPDAAAAAEAAAAEAEAEARREARAADVAAVRALRMALRQVTTRLLVDRRWRAFADPVSPEEVGCAPRSLRSAGASLLGATRAAVQQLLSMLCVLAAGSSSQQAVGLICSGASAVSCSSSSWWTVGCAQGCSAFD